MVEMSLLVQFQLNWQRKFASYLLHGQKVLLAVSGGLDSCVMADLFYQAGIDFMLAHCNFQLRAQESDADEDFVKALAQRYQAPIFFKKFNTEAYAAKQKIGIEEAARNLRYAWFSELMQENEGLRFTATAHHADDNVETILHYFFRGTGLQGLTGIPEKNEDIIRPILFASKKTLLSYFNDSEALAATGFRTDETNFSDQYTRNAIRLQIIPEIKKYFNEVEEVILSNSSRFREVNGLYKEIVETKKKKLLLQLGNEYYLPIGLWLKITAQKTLLWEYLKVFHFTARQMPEVQKLFKAANGSSIASATHRIFRDRKHLIVAELLSDDAAQILIGREDTNIIFKPGILKVSVPNGTVKISNDPFTALLDSQNISFPLLLRKWKVGDYFYPLGMSKKKKLSRFFIDNKLSLSEKENVWVIESNKKIIWVIGYRIDDRFKITTNTKHTLKLVFIKA